MKDHLESKVYCFCLLSMQLCVFALAVCVTGLIILHMIRFFFAAAILEYVVIVTSALYLFLLSFQLGTSRIVSTLTDHTELFLTATGSEGKEEFVEMEVLVR